ncbi:hypothetical protein THER_1518 [Thermodesulfovibrio sp. N1]|nr:hypothetical protein THER_1518 [Thermodesulfovibrio sp. N1]
MAEILKTVKEYLKWNPANQKTYHLKCVRIISRMQYVHHRKRSH